ncbi:hypothetical protein BJ508DRAFT_332376 [Ascobolus immersus RN42]|uniref:Uncharacterized protein n=1 Tax=Ascobolus immersus RN42 TaxID=1160509 RepID=A0A3N4HMX6_ASCIM|nr:hypothetical protein BJ508DRAFT_332376 [Ascobolus immersus RN42]
MSFQQSFVIQGSFSASELGKWTIKVTRKPLLRDCRQDAPNGHSSNTPAVGPTSKLTIDHLGQYYASSPPYPVTPDVAERKSIDFLTEPLGSGSFYQSVTGRQLLGSNNLNSPPPIAANRTPYPDPSNSDMGSILAFFPPSPTPPNTQSPEVLPSPTLDTDSNDLIFEDFKNTFDPDNTGKFDDLDPNPQKYYHDEGFMNQLFAQATSASSQQP